MYIVRLYVHFPVFYLSCIMHFFYCSSVCDWHVLCNLDNFTSVHAISHVQCLYLNFYLGLLYWKLTLVSGVFRICDSCSTVSWLASCSLVIWWTGYPEVVGGREWYRRGTGCRRSTSEQVRATWQEGDGQHGQHRENQVLTHLAAAAIAQSQLDFCRRLAA